MKALVTGAAGFVGRHLCAHLTLQGDTVIGVDRAEGPDLLDPIAVADLLADIKPDVVYHLGGWSDVGASWDFPLDAFRVNAEGTLNLLQACVNNGKPRVLAVSSADIYGHVTPEELPISSRFRHGSVISSKPSAFAPSITSAPDKPLASLLRQSPSGSP